jgi:hypothetical protein
MPDDLTNDQISLLCDIGQFDPTKLPEAKKRNMDRLISGGYAEPTKNDSGIAFKLTAKGSAFLSERGAGWNEA